MRWREVQTKHQQLQVRWDVPKTVEGELSHRTDGFAWLVDGRWFSTPTDLRERLDEVSASQRIRIVYEGKVPLSGGGVRVCKAFRVLVEDSASAHLLH